MDLAVFTPGAYIWPVERNFEAFIASLNAPSGDDRRLATSTKYPAGLNSRDIAAPAAEMENRLTRLHRDIYSGLLAPREQFEGDRRSVAEYFWPDMINTPLDQLISATMFYFVRAEGSDLPVWDGLNVLRSVFFNHEASEPEHWVHTSFNRLAEIRRPYPVHAFSFEAPPEYRIRDLAFVINTMQDRPETSSGWIIGRIRRSPGGMCTVSLQCGVDPSMGETADGPAALVLETEMHQAVSTVFGWQAEVAS